MFNFMQAFAACRDRDRVMYTLQAQRGTRAENRLCAPVCVCVCERICVLNEGFSRGNHTDAPLCHFKTFCQHICEEAIQIILLMRTSWQRRRSSEKETT